MVISLSFPIEYPGFTLTHRNNEKVPYDLQPPVIS